MGVGGLVKVIKTSVVRSGVTGTWTIEKITGWSGKDGLNGIPSCSLTHPCW